MPDQPDRLDLAEQIFPAVVPDPETPFDPQLSVASSMVLAHAFVDIARTLRAILAELQKQNGESK